MGNCYKAEKQALWITGDNPEDKPGSGPDGSSPHAPLFQQNLGFLCELVGALDDAVAEIGARLDAFEFTLQKLFGFLNEPIPLEQLADRITKLREELA